MFALEQKLMILKDSHKNEDDIRKDNHKSNDDLKIKDNHRNEDNLNNIPGVP